VTERQARRGVTVTLHMSEEYYAFLMNFIERAQVDNGDELLKQMRENVKWITLVKIPQKEQKP
jgi:hypothetical protein